MKKTFREWLEDHRNPLLGFGITVLTLLVWMVLMDVVVMPIYTHRGHEEELPDVTEMSFEEARILLESGGFRIVQDQTKHDSNYPAGMVIFQNPAPYSKVKKGRRIYVTVSSGEAVVSVPKLIGRSERDAIFLLNKSGLAVGSVTHSYNGYYPAGVVCDQSFPEAAEIEQRSAVDITVSRGAQPDRFTVPDVVGKNIETAQKMLWESGCAVGEISQEINRRLVPGTVLEQSIRRGTEVGHGTRVDLVVSRTEE